MYLVDQLAIKAGRISEAVARITELIGSDGNISAAQKSAEMQSIRLEMQMLMQDWERTYTSKAIRKNTSASRSTGSTPRFAHGTPPTRTRFQICNTSRFTDQKPHRRHSSAYPPRLKIVHTAAGLASHADRLLQVARDADIQKLSYPCILP